MTDLASPILETNNTGTGSSASATSKLRWLYRLAIVVAVSPIWISAIRNGLNHWIPTHDAATTALRTRDVFSAHPPLVGLAAQTSAIAEHHYSYLGALQFYLLAVPVRLFGLTWGPLLGMATINTICGVVFAWLLRRRVGEIGAIIGCAFFASLLWSAGSQVIVDLTPVVMGLIPATTLMVAAWSAADGDDRGVLVLAVVANYLFLGHLKFAVVVPVLVVYGLVGWWWQARRRRREDPGEWSAGRRARRGWLGAAGIFTVLVWIPPLYQQYSVPDGNIGAVISAALHGQADSHQAAVYAPTIHGALGMVVSTIAVPPLWLRPSFDNPNFNYRGEGTPFVLAALGVAVLAVAYLGLAWWSRRHGDRTMLLGLGMVVLAWVAWFVTATKNPAVYGFRARYFHGLWPLAMMTWLMVVLGLLRRLPSIAAWHRGRPVLAGAFAVTLLAAVAAVPYANFGAGTNERVATKAKLVREAIVNDVPRNGPVLVKTSAANWNDRELFPSALLALQDIGVHFRVERSFDVQQYGAFRAFDPVRRNATTVIEVHTEPRRPPPGSEQVVLTAPKKGQIDQATFEAYDHDLRDWAASVGVPRLNADAPIAADLRALGDQVLASAAKRADANDTSLIDDADFVHALRTLAGTDEWMLVDPPDLTTAQVRAWVTYKEWSSTHSIYVDIGPVR